MECLSKMKVEIYGAPNCTYCKQSMFLCESADIEYEYICMMMNPDKAMEAQSRVTEPFRSVPQIFIDGDHIGGFTEFERKINESKD